MVKQDSTQPHHFEGVPDTYIGTFLWLANDTRKSLQCDCNVEIDMRITSHFSFPSYHYFAIYIKSWKCGLDGIKL